LRPTATRPKAKPGVPRVAHLDVRTPSTGCEGAPPPPVPVPVLPRGRPRPPGEGELLPRVLIAVDPGPVEGSALQRETQRAATDVDPAEAVVPRDSRVLRRRETDRATCREAENMFTFNRDTHVVYPRRFRTQIGTHDRK